MTDPPITTPDTAILSLDWVAEKLTYPLVCAGFLKTSDVARFHITSGGKILVERIDGATASNKGA